MAPKAAASRGAKRTAQQKKDAKAEADVTSEVEAKRPRVEPAVQAVCDVIEGSDLPEACRAMLLACTPAVFETIAAERHEGQQRVMRMIGEVMASAVAKLQANVDAAMRDVAESDAAKDALQASVAEAERLREAAAQVAEARRLDAMRASSDVAEAANRLSEAKEKDRVDGAGAVADQAKLAVLGKLVETINDDSPDVVPTAILGMLESVIPLVTLDASLVKALPDACGKKPSERGTFDKIALVQLEQCAKDEMQKISARLAEAAPAMQERAAAVESAKAAIERALQHQRESSQWADDAQRGMKDAEAGVCQARVAQAAQEPQRRAVMKKHDEAQQIVQCFKAHNVQCFENFLKRERPLEKSEAEPEQVQAAVASSPAAKTAPEAAGETAEPAQIGAGGA